MPDTIPADTLEKFTTFGDLLRYLRRRAGITQTELSIAVGYSISQISRLEQNLRLPDIPTIQARFIEPLGLEEEPKTIARLIELAAAIRREDAPALGLCPYKGLDYFDEGDAELFVGREGLTEKIIHEVLALISPGQTEAGRFFAIVGASGSGKSSLVRAGLVPALRWNKQSANWQILVLTPTAHPLESLATTLTRESSLTATAQLMDDLAQERRALSLYIKRELKNSSGTYFLLVIDQFEELFALCRFADERSAFIDAILTAAYDEDGKAIVVITLRADFYAHCASSLQLRQALATHQEYIGAMNDEEMRRAIEEPARRGRWEFEEGLVDLILHDVGHEPGALPLLSHALLETWQRRQGRKMTLSGYTASGGVRGAIAETAEAVFTDQFNLEQQTIARRIFLRLTELGDETATGDTRRRATINELMINPEEMDATQLVLKALADARLVTTSEDSVQVAHEALIREWPTLRRWLEENREGLRQHRQLTEASQEWAATEREPGILFRSGRLAQARDWAVTHLDDMNALEKEFLEASISAGEREAAEREAQRQRELQAAQQLADHEKRRAKERGRAIILVTSIGILAVVLALMAFFAWQRSASQAAVNLSLSLSAAAQRVNDGGQSDLALALAKESVNMAQPPSQALRVLREVALGSGTRAVLNGYQFPAQSADISPDEKSAVSAGCAQMDSSGACQASDLIIWDLVAMKELSGWSAQQAGVNHVAYSQDGQHILSSALDGSLIVWNLMGEIVQKVTNLPGKVTDFAFVPNTNDMLLGLDDGSMIRWNLTSDERIYFTKSASPITALSIASQSPIAVTAHLDGSLTVWDLTTHEFIRSFASQESGIQSVVLTPDGKQIIFSIAGGITVIRRIDSLDGRLINEQPTGCVPTDLALSVDATHLLVGCLQEVMLIDVPNWKVEYEFIDFPTLVNSVSINSNGSLGLATLRDGSLRVYNLGNQESYNIIDIEVDELDAIAVSSDGKYLLLNDGAKDGSSKPALWDIDQKKVVLTYTLPISDLTPTALQISPDNQMAAAAGTFSNSPTVVVWDLKTGSLQCPSFTDFTLIEGYYGRAVAFSPDSRYLLAGTQTFGGSNGELVLWDVQTCKLIKKFNNSEDVTSIAFSSDGRLAITGIGYLGRVTLWDVASGEAIGRYPYTEWGPVLDVAFGPDDKTILGSGLFDLYLWDVDTKEIIRRYSGLTLYPYNLSLSPDKKYVLSGNMNGELLLWDFATGEEADRLNTHLSIVSTVITPDSKTAYAAAMEGKLIEWPIAEMSLPELLDWIKANRYVRELTCAEKLQYHVASVCKP